MHFCAARLRRHVSELKMYNTFLNREDGTIYLVDSSGPVAGTRPSAGMSVVQAMKALKQVFPIVDSYSGSLPALAEGETRPLRAGEEAKFMSDGLSRLAGMYDAEVEKSRRHRELAELLESGELERVTEDCPRSPVPKDKPYKAPALATRQ